MNYIIIQVILLTVKCTTLQIGVTLNGPQLVKRFDSLYLNCSSDQMPIDSAANLNINKIYYTSIRLVNGKCFSSVLERECLPGNCDCSEESLWFGHFYNVTQPESVIDISCSMVFGIQGTFSSSIQVTIIDFLGPEITTDLAFPLRVGSQVNFTCSVEGIKRKINFVWDCLDNKAIATSVLNEDNAKFTSMLTGMLKIYHDGNACICTANVDGYIATTSIQLEIDKKPNLQLEESVSCNSSSLAIMSCVILNVLPIYGFTSWIHYYQGTLIRFLNGHTQGNQSILIIEPCSYQDTGEYTCIAWNEYVGNRVYSNKTVTLFVYSAPVVIATNIVQKQNGSCIYIWFFSPSDNITTIWTHQNKQITNSTQIIQTLNQRTVQVQFYNKSIDSDGYIASILFSSIINGQYEVLLRNEFSETRQRFEVKITKSKGLVTSFNFRSLVFGISAFGIFIVTTTGAAILFKRRSYNNVVHIVSPHERSTIPIYHSAPSAGPVVHIYDTANSGYLEVVDHDSMLRQNDASGDEYKEIHDSASTSANTDDNYEEIDYQ